MKRYITIIFLLVLAVFCEYGLIKGIHMILTKIHYSGSHSVLDAFFIITVIQVVVLVLWFLLVNKNEERDMNEIWRDDGLNKGESPTVYTTVEVAEDIYKQIGVYFIRIDHVLSFHGKGFKPVVYSICGGHYCTGSVALGIGQQAYNKAVTEGELIAKKNMDELNEEDIHGSENINKE